jgi:esterase/lipase
MDLDGKLEINQAAYEWTERFISALKKILRVHLKLHQSKDQINAGEIFLFNHFARFETFIPQYLIYQETGAFCRCVASSDFFAEGSAFSNYLLSIGGVPNNHPRLLPFLAEEILRGRKVIIFPEGGMVKDRRVLDRSGQYSVYSPTARKIRKHHTGGAILALTLEVFKAAILRAHETGDMRRVRAWVEEVGLESEEALIAAARRPTLIVPAAITFYPIRANDNVLRKAAELLSRGLSRRLSEELLIEGNILLEDTDMDIRLGDPLRPAEFWHWQERQLIAHLAPKIDSLERVFQLTRNGEGWIGRAVAWRARRNALQIRDEYMRRMYAGVTVNFGHLASRLILTFVAKGQMKVDHAMFHKTLYLAVKNVQKEPSVNLHRGLKNPEAYSGVVDGECHGLSEFLETAVSMNLIESQNGRYRFLPKICQEHGFDVIRLENLIAVYANEVAPVSGVARSVERAIEETPALDDQTLAGMRFDDELRAYAWDRQYFSKTRYTEINRQETATENGEPFLFLPEGRKELGVLLVHGFLASPAEVRPFGEKLKGLGYPVIGVRLKGHGTSPWDLWERSWQDWLESVRRGYMMMSAFARRICLVGFSTGGALSLRLAADCPERLAGVAAISVPMKFRDGNMTFVPLVHRTNQLVRWVSSSDGIVPFRRSDSEHPHINYRNVPIRSLYELRRMVHELEECLPDVQCPVTLIQGIDDPIVGAEGAELIHKRLSTSQKRLFMIPSTRHGILYQDIGDTQERIISFLSGLSASYQADRDTIADSPSLTERLIKRTVAWIGSLVAAKQPNQL